MNNFSPYFNSINMTRNLSPFATAGSSAITNATRSTGLMSKLGGSKMTLSGILNGAQKTIGTVNQIVPIYNQIKPMFQNSKVLLSVAKSLKGNNNSKYSFRNKRNRNYQHIHEPINIEPSIKAETIKKEEKQIENSPSKPFFL